MKEYKVVCYKGSMTFSIDKHTEELSNFLNNFARQGWRVIDCKNLQYFILEKDKH